MTPEIAARAALEDYGLVLLDGDTTGTWTVGRPNPQDDGNCFVLAEGMSLAELTIYVKHLDTLTPDELDGWRPAPDIHGVMVAGDDGFEIT